jgi:hypothetical protein
MERIDGEIDGKIHIDFTELKVVYSKQLTMAKQIMSISLSVDQFFNISCKAYNLVNASRGEH